ncbi:MAG: hydantoinase/oxoprolinase family protein [bacterium]
MKKNSGKTIRVGVDTGGTFTDFILIGRGRSLVHKVLSTPDDPARAILKGLADLAEAADGRPLDFTHGSTVATNAVLTRNGAKTALVTTAGFEDVIEIGRQNRKDLYDLAYHRPRPLVPRRLRFGVSERLDERGRVVDPLDTSGLKPLAEKLKRAGVEAVAVCFLHSYANPDHEEKTAAVLRGAGLAVSLSSRVLPEYREYERTSTTCVNAYVSPLMSQYLGGLEREMGPGRLRIMQSNGGVISAGTASREAVRTILSGPAGGVVGGFEAARAAGFENVITFDMGGTSTDVSLLQAGIGFSAETEVAGCPIRVPVIDIHTVGAGGGSIARRDPGGALAVGPESAGADPGPICYGKGSRVTVTDANLFLGRIDAERFLGGRMPLYLEKAAAGIAKLAKSLGLTPVEAAEGVLRIADQHMAGAIRLISVERGHDSREFALVSFGGAGGMHACSLARILDIPTVVVPKDPGILSARGMLTADVVKDYARTVLLPAEEADGAALSRHFRAMLAEAEREMREEGFSRVRIERYAGIRYLGQSHELTIPLPKQIGKNMSARLRSAFDRRHQERFGTSNANRPVEIVTLRLRASGRVKKPAATSVPKGGRDGGKARAGSRAMVFGGKKHQGAVYERDLLRAGDRFRGPAVVTEFSATTVVPPGVRCRVDARGNLVMDVDGSKRR